MVRLLTNDIVSNVLIILQKEKRSLNKLKHWYVQATMSSLHWESHCIFNLLKFLKWIHHIIMPTLLDYLRVTQIQSQSPTLPYGWPELPDERKFGSVAHKKLRFKLHMFQNSKITGFLYLYFSFWLHFLAKCMLFIANNYISESLIRWVFNKLKSLTDRSTFSLWNCSNNKKKFSRGGCIVKFCWEGVLVRKKISRFEISRDWYLCIHK